MAASSLSPGPPASTRSSGRTLRPESAVSRSPGVIFAAQPAALTIWTSFNFSMSSPCIPYLSERGGKGKGAKRPPSPFLQCLLRTEGGFEGIFCGEVCQLDKAGAPLAREPVGSASPSPASMPFAGGGSFLFAQKRTKKGPCASLAARRIFGKNPIRSGRLHPIKSISPSPVDRSPLSAALS